MKNNSKYLKIKKVNQLDDFKLEIFFSNQKAKTINFKPFLNKSQHSEIRKYLKPSKFKNYKLVDGELMWGDFDLIFPIADLYNGVI